MAVWQGDGVKVIANEVLGRTTASCVAFSEDERLLGWEAKQHAVVDPSCVVVETKRLLGRGFRDAAVRTAASRWHFTVVEGPRGRPQVEVRWKGEAKRFFA